MSAMLKEAEKIRKEQEETQRVIDNTNQMFDSLFDAMGIKKGPVVTPYVNRLAGLEDTIMLSRPDYCEAAESILAPMMAVLEKRYDWRECKSYQQIQDVKEAYEKLSKALMAAYDAEES